MVYDIKIMNVFMRVICFNIPWKAGKRQEELVIMVDVLVSFQWFTTCLFRWLFCCLLTILTASACKQSCLFSFLCIDLLGNPFVPAANIRTWRLKHCKTIECTTKWWKLDTCILSIYPQWCTCVSAWKWACLSMTARCFISVLVMHCLSCHQMPNVTSS